MNEEKIIENLRRCPRFHDCNINFCPLDLEANSKKGKDENQCPFSIKKKTKDQKGMKTLAPNCILQFIPKSNLKMLNRRNQKRWHEIKRNV